MKLGGFDIAVLRECTFRLDGGAMFGHVPKVVWEKLIPPDAQNRIPLACNVLLVKHGKHVVLCDAGMGTKWPAKEAALYDLKSESLTGFLAANGVTPEQVTHVMLTHLHIDHAGGLTVQDGDHLRPLFPNARHIVQLGEWIAATSPDIRSKPSYRPVDFASIREAGLFDFAEGDASPLPYCKVHVTGGHTAWHQFVEFHDGTTRLFFPGDLFPTTAHLRPNYAMGYDLYPLQVIDQRLKWLPILAEPGSVVCFEHDASVSLARVTHHDSKYSAIPLAAGSSI